MSEALFQSDLKSLRLRNRGKVRDIYDVDDRHLLIVTTDRLSAFDVVLPDPIPGKGAVLTAMSNFWFGRMGSIIPNQLTDTPLEKVLKDPAERKQVDGRATLVKKLKPLPVEAIVRGYIVGSGWKEYQKSGTVCGIQLPAGLREADKLPEPIFTPSTKAETGHDLNITEREMAGVVGEEAANRLKELTLEVYRRAADFAISRGIIIADTKLEFGVKDGQVILVDEVLTPDSSRFWPLDGYQPGRGQQSFDKQYLRDYLETVNWEKLPPAPKIPEAVIARTREKYLEAYRLLTGESIADCGFRIAEGGAGS